MTPQGKVYVWHSQFHFATEILRPYILGTVQHPQDHLTVITGSIINAALLIRETA